METIYAILKTLKSFGSAKDVPFRKRSPQEIISSGVFSGCSDVALAFAYLCKSSEIRVHIVDTFDKIMFSKTLGMEGITGHVYCQVFNSDDTWVMVDPTVGAVDVDICSDGRVPIVSYLDNSKLLSYEELCFIKSTFQD